MSHHKLNRKQRRPGDLRFGLRPPADGSPAPFRVLISVRWLAAGLVWFGALAVSVIAFGRRVAAVVVGASVAGGIGGVVAAIAQAARIRHEVVPIPVRDLPPELDGFRIAQLADLHLGAWFTWGNVRAARRWVEGQQPDVIVLTGDFVGHRRHLPVLREALDGMAAPCGVFGIFGNHDYWTDIPALEGVLRDCGVDVLRNEQRLITIGSATLALVGVDCVWEDRHDVELALRDRPVNAITVALAHEPDIADTIAPCNVALQLSGHTHAGHVALPGLGPAFLPRHGFRYFRGLHRVGNMWVYVSRGLGGLPLRFGARPEVTLLVLRREA
jgi:uncharacterized protein